MRIILMSVLMFLVQLISPYHVESAPQVDLVEGSSNVKDTQLLNIYGSKFGIHPMAIKWLGGPNGKIENGISGTDIDLGTGWSGDRTSESRQSPQYSNSKSHSGGKSIKSATPNNTQYTSGFLFDNVVPFDAVFVSWWVYVENLQCIGDCAGNSQWKIIRVTPGLGNGIYADQPHSWYWPQQVASPLNTFINGRYMFMNFCKSNTIPTYDSTCYAGNIQIYKANGIIENKWHRIDIYTKQNSLATTSDGTVVIDLGYETEGTKNFVNYQGNTVTRSSTDPKWRYIVWENYLGNGLERADIYIDDIYVQFGSRSRVEIGDSPTWSLCKHKEIQIPVTWNENTIAFTVNQGSFPLGKAYIYVLDEYGAVNEIGKEIAFTSGNTWDPRLRAVPPP